MLLHAASSTPVQQASCMCAGATCKKPSHLAVCHTRPTWCQHDPRHMAVEPAASLHQGSTFKCQGHVSQPHQLYTTLHITALEVRQLVVSCSYCWCYQNSQTMGLSCLQGSTLKHYRSGMLSMPLDKGRITWCNGLASTCSGSAWHSPHQQKKLVGLGSQSCYRPCIIA